MDFNLSRIKIRAVYFCNGQPNSGTKRCCAQGQFDPWRSNNRNQPSIKQNDTNYCPDNKIRKRDSYGEDFSKSCPTVKPKANNPNFPNTPIKRIVLLNCPQNLPKLDRVTNREEQSPLALIQEWEPYSLSTPYSLSSLFSPQPSTPSLQRNPSPSIKPSFPPARCSNWVSCTSGFGTTKSRLKPSFGSPIETTH